MTDYNQPIGLAIVVLLIIVVKHAHRVETWFKKRKRSKAYQEYQQQRKKMVKL